MGQKINPIGLRLKIIKSWKSNWFSKKDYSKLLHEDIKIRNYIMKKLGRSGVSGVIIERSPKQITLSIFTSRPGVIIGRSGAGIEQLKEELKKITNTEIRINIQEVKNPELDAYLVALNVASQLEKRISFRRALKQAIDKAVKNGCKGIKVAVSGRLGGVEMARKEWLAWGKMPLQTLRADIDYAYVPALTNTGVIGVKVWLYKGEVFEKQEKESKKPKIEIDI